MQRGQPIAVKDSKDYPSNQYIYQMICKELNTNICQREQSRVELKRCSDEKHQSVLLDRLDKLEVEFTLLNKLKNRIENPDYYDKVVV